MVTKLNCNLVRMQRRDFYSFVTGHDRCPLPARCCRCAGQESCAAGIGTSRRGQVRRATAAHLSSLSEPVPTAGPNCLYIAASERRQWQARSRLRRAARQAAASPQGDEGTYCCNACRELKMKSIKEGIFFKLCLAKGSSTEPMRKTWGFFQLK